MQRELLILGLSILALFQSQSAYSQPIDEASITGDWADDSVENLFTDAVYNGSMVVTATQLVAKSSFQIEQVSPKNPSLILAGCSGVLIDKDVLLTAGHCIPDKGIDLYVVVNSANSTASKRLKVVQTVLHEKFNAIHVPLEGDVVYNDIALIRTETVVPGGVPALLPKGDLKIAHNQAILSAGFGLNGHNPTEDDLVKDPKIRALVAKIKANPNNKQVQIQLEFQILDFLMVKPLLTANFSANLSTNQKPGEAQMELSSHSHSICEGDSGGPSFLRQDSGSLVVLGIHSTTSDVNCNGFSGLRSNGPATAEDTYVPSYLDWIKTNIKTLQGQNI